MLAKKTSKNQITLPKKIVEQFPQVDYFDVSVEGSVIVLRPVRPDQLERVQEKLAEMGISDADVGDAVAWARSSR